MQVEDWDKAISLLCIDINIQLALHSSSGLQIPSTHLTLAHLSCTSICYLINDLQREPIPQCSTSSLSYQQSFNNTCSAFVSSVKIYQNIPSEKHGIGGPAPKNTWSHPWCAGCHGPATWTTELYQVRLWEHVAQKNWKRSPVFLQIKTSAKDSAAMEDYIYITRTWNFINVRFRSTTAFSWMQFDHSKKKQK